MPEPSAGLARLLQVDPVGPELAEGIPPDTGRPRVFGGLVVAQALLAGGMGVPPDRHVHGLQAVFLQPGDPSRVIRYRTEDLREGRSFSTRRVLALQGDQPILQLTASFHRTEPGDDHADAPPDAPDPDTLPELPPAELPDPVAAHIAALSGIELRYAPLDDLEDRPTRQQVWFRVRDPLPAQAALHAAALAYASDLTVLVVALLPHGLRPRQRQMASLDHAMWFHRPVRADTWQLYDLRAVTTAGARGLGAGRIFQAGRTHVASVAQEGLMRPPR